jgi:hypothetical protein
MVKSSLDGMQDMLSFLGRGGWLPPGIHVMSEAILQVVLQAECPAQGELVAQAHGSQRL